MSLLEIIFGAILLVLVLAIAIPLGWIVILMCMIEGPGRHGGSACEAAPGVFFMYIVVGIIFFGVRQYKALGKQELPFVWRIMALFVSTKERQINHDPDFDASAFQGGLNAPTTKHGRRMWTSVFAESADRLERRRSAVEKETERYMEAMMKRAEAAEKLHRAKARRDALREFEERFGRDDDG